MLVFTLSVMPVVPRFVMLLLSMMIPVPRMLLM